MGAMAGPVRVAAHNGLRAAAARVAARGRAARRRVHGAVRHGGRRPRAPRPPRPQRAPPLAQLQVS